ncbi:MAG TPA: cell division protein FtsZ [Solirubrobacteraceae bacterium]|nr:cell division protein FtsZ [Solirubrobacteraceae bacterium]
MASDKRASMRHGPLAALFSRTDTEEHKEEKEAGAPSPSERLRKAFNSETGAVVPGAHKRRHAPARAKPQGPVLRVVGVGGAGTNAVDRMIEAEVAGVEFLAVNTDLQSLQQSAADTTVAIGQELTGGRGSGSDPTVGRQAALADADVIKESLKGSDMVFVTAGSGGGTGSGAAPIVARIAREVGALTVGVVTTPFAFEGKRRAEAAEHGIQALSDEVDTVIIVPNERLLSVLDKQTSMVEAFRVADDVLRQGVQGVSDLITLPGLINLDFADVCTIMSDAGTALLGIGIGSGEHRASEAAEQAVSSPLLETSMDGARSILLSITGGESLSLWEVNEAAKAVSAAAHPDANIIFGATVDEKLSDEVWVTVVATGYGDRGRRKSVRSMHEPAGEVRIKRAAPPAPALKRERDFDVPEFLPGR